MKQTVLLLLSGQVLFFDDHLIYENQNIIESLKQNLPPLHLNDYPDEQPYKSYVCNIAEELSLLHKNSQNDIICAKIKIDELNKIHQKGFKFAYFNEDGRLACCFNDPEDVKALEHKDRAMNT